MDMADMERLDKIVRESQQRMTQLSEVEDKLAQVISRHTTDDGAVTVELASDGMLRNLEIDPRAMRLSSSALSERITEAFRAAQRGLQEEVGRAISGAIGTENPADLMEEAKELRNSMDGALENISRSVNEAVIQAHRITGRR